MSKVVRIDNIGKMIDTLVDSYNKGEIIELIIVAELPNQQFGTQVSKNMTYVKSLGYLEAVKGDIQARALVWDEE